MELCVRDRKGTTMRPVKSLPIFFLFVFLKKYIDCFDLCWVGGNSVILDKLSFFLPNYLLIYVGEDPASRAHFTLCNWVILHNQVDQI